jgi:hypothetical protein
VRVHQPASVRRLPVYKDIPIPFTALVDRHGVPDFKVIDQAKHQLCLQERRCGICGEQMGRFICFIGGQGSLNSRAFVDAPMHEACARFAFTLCPFLLGRKGYSEHVKDHGPEYAMQSDIGGQTERPTEMGLFITTGFAVTRSRHGETILMAEAPHRITLIPSPSI